MKQKLHKSLTNLGLPDMPLGISGVNFLRTASNMAGLKGLPTSITSVSFFFMFEQTGISNSATNSVNAAKVG